MTKRLYYDDPWRLDFEARVLGHSEWDGRESLILDESAFYPESGGQMADHGALGGLPVSDVQADDTGRVHHLVDGALPEPGASVEGRVDWRRRRTHMSLHTGQHMLSRALFDVLGGETLSSRLGEKRCTIDLDIEPPSDADLARCEDLVNDLVDHDTKVRAYFPEPNELASLELRRAPKVEGPIRVVHIPDFDITPCGGTHCTSTGQVGLVRLDRVERYKGGSRITFSAGDRARTNLRYSAITLKEACGVFSCAGPELVGAIEKRSRELKLARQALGQARAELAQRVARELEATNTEAPIIALLPGLGVDALRGVARRLTAEGARVALLATTADEGLHILTVRGPGSDFDCGAFLRRAAEAGGGRGGGRPDRAEGRLPTGVDWEELARGALTSSV